MGNINLAEEGSRLETSASHQTLFENTPYELSVITASI